MGKQQLGAGYSHDGCEPDRAQPSQRGFQDGEVGFRAVNFETRQVRDF